MTRHNVSTYSAQLAKPTFRYGQRAQLPLQLNAATAHVRVTIPADIPDNAIVTKADLVFGVVSPWAGSRTFNKRRHSALWNGTITWTNRPGVTGTTISKAVVDPTAATTFILDALDDVQGYISGTLDNFGWQIATTSASQSLLDGVAAAVDAPYLDLEWVLPGEPPTDLAPHGRIATGNPTLTFQLPEGSTHIQVQVGTLEDFSAGITFDSGQVVAAGNAFELTAHTIPDPATRYWRIKAWAGGVESDWSAPAELIRDDHPAFTIDSPGATTGDPAAPAGWSAFANQTAWQAQLYDHNLGRVVADSGRTVGTDQAWTPPSGLRGEGTATWTVRLWDDKDDRVPTPGVPVYAQVEHTFAVNAGGADGGPTDLTVTQRGGTPIIDLAWTWAAPLPAGWKAQIIRNGVWLERVAGDVLQYADRTAPRFVNLTYKVVPVSPAGVVSTLGPSELIYPQSFGVWLLDPDVDFAETAAAVLLGKDQGAQDMTEQAIVHAVNGRAPVRRRIGIPPPSGTFPHTSHVLMDALGVTAAAAFAQLMVWKPRDAGTVYRLVLGDWNIPVTVGDIQAFPTAASGSETQYAAGFGWWQTDDELPW